MSFLGMVEAKLPPGFRFYPRDDELICDYLFHRIMAAGSGGGGKFHGFPSIIDVDLNKCEPWHIPNAAKLRGKEWYFFSMKDKKYATGQRTNRATAKGYWKATGKDRNVLQKEKLVGMRKTLVFYKGRAPKGMKTKWVMHEFRMEFSSHPPNFTFKEDWVLCRIFYKSRSISPKSSDTSDGEEDTCSSSLPALMDSQIMAYNQVPFSLEGLEQVPCFSNLYTASQNALHPLTQLEFSYCDKKALKTVLSQLTGLEESHQTGNENLFFDSAVTLSWN